MRQPTARAAEIFRRYEDIRHRLPRADFPTRSHSIEHLEDLADEIDVFFLDAFGVLNVGDSPVPGAVERLRALTDLGKQIFVITNGASYGAANVLEKYRSFGFDFAPHQVISSRNTARAALMTFASQMIWGVVAMPTAGLDEIDAKTVLLLDDPETYDEVDGVLFLSSAEWTPARQILLTRSLQKKPRPVLVGNPDLVAPREYGLSLEPGYYAHELADETGINPQFFGKPFASIFTYGLAQPALKEIPKHRVAMVGDTLHTDILGGAAAGIRTVLITDHGLLKDENIPELIASSGIVPDFISRTT
ncbi:HAD-IIA family hydrolase [Sneathiella marina]|uniref:HAD-IIA family hydrolase n=1 Tax=Sneathiella marina TaxID=2950108 RepID=A0ABY4W180_9PROT|nr:HAD-IIA family hydrolase [Sneathiella marina]USG60900.1 HAD-IIA family hydrolase [Sneathiella marina]